MQSVFLAGSIKIRRIPEPFLERLDNLLAADLHVLVGDANGADKAMQEVLLSRGARTVTVYCSGDAPRNNIGGWNVRAVPSSAALGTRQFFAAKDLAMASAADFGLMLWDAKSTGTLSNVVELTKKQKKCVIYVAPTHSFAIVRDAASLRNLVALMADDARSEAESKIGLTAKMRAISDEQFGLPF